MARGFRLCFPKLIDVFDSQCRPLVSLRVFVPLFRLHTAETENSPPAFFFLYFIYGLLLRKSYHLPPPLITFTAKKSLGPLSREEDFCDFGIVHFTQVL